MRFIFIGSGAAFVKDPHNYQSNILLQSPSKELLLIDCGTDARRALNELNLTHRDIANVYISHLHADHAGGLEWLAFTRKFDQQKCSKPNLYISKRFTAPLWDHTLSGGLTSLSDEPASLSAFFQVYSIPEGQGFQWQNINFQLIKSQHILSNFAEMPSYGLFFQVNNRWIYLTTDAQFQLENFLPYYRQASLIFQDCETSAHPSGVHAHYQQLKALDPSIKSKMWLYHYNCDHDGLPDAVADGFCGFVKPRQVFELG
ncbi:MAG: MBL fold metallo-hydrolase [Proteobacteria bacterium]|nr:MBL fold metallo-hydrolase [Pseudomonadota bacterium]